MKSSTILTLLLGGISTTLSASLKPRQSADSTLPTFTIQEFTTRRYDGVSINTVFFTILSANGGTLDFECGAYDPALGHNTDAFEIGKVYACGNGSFFSFSYTPNSGDGVDDLFLWQNVSDTQTLGGSATPPEGICRAGGNGMYDLICMVPDSANFNIVMKEL